jgi:uncharacterized protein DUF4232
VKTRLLIPVAVLALVAATSAGAAKIAPACTGSQLSATFKVVPNSEGAGNIVYALVVKNTSSKACSVNGLPKGVLLNQQGKVQATHVLAAAPGTMQAVIPLKHNGTTRASARFSPDIAGPGENGRQCEPKSYWFRLTAPGGGTLKAKLSPATSVCEHGQLQFSYYGH